MRVSEQVSGWMEEALQRSLTPNEVCWYDVTMAPMGGGPEGNAPFLAVMLCMKSPLVRETLNLSRFFPDFVFLDQPGVDLFVDEALMQLRTARTEALRQANGTGTPDSPGKLFLPGAGQ